MSLSSLLLHAVILGSGATLFMDMVALLQRRLLGIPSLDYALVGRWIGHLPSGTLVHRPIGASAPIRGEAFLGWAAHYLIGIAFAVLFLAAMGANWLDHPKALPALIFGLISTAAPFLVLQPGLGAGLAARKTPRPAIARMRSVFAHLAFGLGLWVTAFAIL